MEHYKISKLLNDSIIPKFMTKKWIEINDLSSGQYSDNKNVRFKASMLRSDLYDYSGAYADVKRRISIAGTIMLTEKMMLLMMLHLGHAYQKLIAHL